MPSHYHVGPLLILTGCSHGGFVRTESAPKSAWKNAHEIWQNPRGFHADFSAQKTRGFQCGRLMLSTLKFAV